MRHKAENYIGWYGVMAILLAYCLVSFNIIEAKSYIYQILNFTGAVALVIETLSKKDKQPAVLNIVWATIALVAIINLFIN